MQTHPSATVILVGLIALISGSANAQSAPERRLTVSLGAIEAIQSYPQQRRFVMYPEVEVYSSLYRSKAAGLTLGGSLYFAGWTDDGEGMTGCRHCITYSHTSAILGARGAVRLDQFLLLPLSFIAGVAYHSIWADYLEGEDWRGQGQDHRRSEVAIESGVHLDIPISARITLEPRGHVVLPLPYPENNPSFARFVLSVGFSYLL